MLDFTLLCPHSLLRSRLCSQFPSSFLHACACVAHLLALPWLRSLAGNRSCRLRQECDLFTLLLCLCLFCRDCLAKCREMVSREQSTQADSGSGFAELRS